MKKIWVGTAAAFLLIAASWIGNVWYYQEHQLGEPFFLEHHLEVLRGPGDTFDLYYLENLEEDNPVSSIYFPEYPELNIVLHTPAYVKYSHQQLGRFIVSVGESSKGSHRKVLDLIRTVQIVYNDGSIASQNIGEVRFIQDPSEGGAENPVQVTSGGSGSHGGGIGTGYDVIQVSRAVKLEVIESAFLPSEEAHIMEVYLDHWPSTRESQPPNVSEGTEAISMTGKPLKEVELPISLNNGDGLRLSYKYNTQKEKLGVIYRPVVRLEFKEQDGLKWTAFVYLEMNSPDFTEAEVRSLVKERGRGL